MFGGFWRSVCHHDSPLAAPHLGKVLTGERVGGLGLVDLVHALVGGGPCQIIKIHNNSFFGQTRFVFNMPHQYPDTSIVNNNSTGTVLAY